ncbi:hypothetical protein [Streptomyces palmae]|uniref:hypothetical protein n=1 Tax=Streptomyces palmae TaxID=1701085 RepID=UPI0014331087|nr:hypothetical protein [Streptomyces palmae]
MAWPNKTIPHFTDEELDTAIEEHENSSNPVAQQITQDCWREWERRKGLPVRD